MKSHLEIGKSAYDKNFNEYTTYQNSESALIVVQKLLDLLGNINSVIDVGCGQGVWLASWKKNGVKHVCGLDQIKWSQEGTLLSKHEFISIDFDTYLRRAPNYKSQKYDICQCLEVAEHLDPRLSIDLVCYLTSLSDIVVFSSAPPGQGGENHINEKPYTWWKTIFEAQGYEMYDSIRPIIINEDSVKPWYKYNMFVYVSANSESIRVTHIRNSLANYIDKNSVPPELAPFFYRARKLAVRFLPVKAQNYLAKLKYVISLFNHARSNRSHN